MGRLADTHLSLGAIPFSSKPGDFIELSKRFKPASLVTIANDFEAVTLEFRDGIQLLSGGSVEVDHAASLSQKGG